MINNFSKFGWTNLLKNKFKKLVTKEFAPFLDPKKTKLIDTDGGKHVVNIFFYFFGITMTLRDILNIPAMESFCRKV